MPELGWNKATANTDPVLSLYDIWGYVSRGYTAMSSLFDLITCMIVVFIILLEYSEPFFRYMNLHSMKSYNRNSLITGTCIMASLHWKWPSTSTSHHDVVVFQLGTEIILVIRVQVCNIMFPFPFIGGFLAATKQLYEWFSPSVCPSVCLSVTPFWLSSHHRIIMKFSGVITNDRSDVHAKGQGQRSKVKVTKVNTQLSHFRTVTPVWIHIWWWNDAQSLMLLRRGSLLFFKVIRQISRSHS